MKIGIYLDAARLGTWSWTDFDGRCLPVSGTDALSLFLATRLPRCGIEVVVFTTNPGAGRMSGLQQQVDSTRTAVQLAKQQGMCLLIFNNAGNQDTLQGLEASSAFQQDVVVVDQNGPAPQMADALASCLHVRRVVCVSESQTRGVRDHPVFRKIEVINNPLLASTERVSVPRDPHAVAFLGSLTASKGFHHVAAAWQSVRSLCPEASLRVIGSAKLYNREQALGPLGVAESEYETEGICRHLGHSHEEAAAKGVRFLGLLTPAEVQDELRRVSICVVNPNCRTSTETFCVSAIEASASGAAVVGARYGGLRETVAEGQTGILIKHPNDLGKAIVRLLKQPELARQFGETGRMYVAEKFGQDQIASEWSNLLTRVAQGMPPSPPGFHFDGSLRLLLRESIRLMRHIPGLHWLPALSHIRRAIRGSGQKSRPPA